MESGDGVSGLHVAPHWAQRLELEERELISFVGAGGKTSLMVGLGNELAEAGHRVVITTTTKIGADQVQPPVVDSVSQVEANFGRRPGPVFVVHRDDESKVTGPTPIEINHLYRDSSAAYILVEADGARGRSLKAPAAFEPVIPTRSTIVVLVAGIDVIGASIASSCHRPERVAELLGKPVTHSLGVQDVAKVLTSASGGLKDVPADARVIVVVTKVGPEDVDAARRLSQLVASDPDVERVVIMPRWSQTG
jgi:molybdenum cofactor cytidylyltransferase